MDAIRFATDAWNNVEPSTITSCWKRTNILAPFPDDIEEFVNLPSDSENDEDAVQRLIDNLNLETPLTAKEYLDIDLTLQTEDRLDDDAIISLVQGEEAIEENEDKDLDVERPIITSREVVELIDKLTHFLTHGERHIQVSEKFLCELKDVKRTLCRTITDSKVQTDITSFFSTD